MIPLSDPYLTTLFLPPLVDVVIIAISTKYDL